MKKQDVAGLYLPKDNVEIVPVGLDLGNALEVVAGIVRTIGQAVDRRKPTIPFIPDSPDGLPV